MLVEWSLGTAERYSWDGERLVPKEPPWRPEWGLAPVNYGLIPGYHNPADHDTLDAIWAGREPVPVGSWLEGEVLGMIWVSDLDLGVLWQWFRKRQPRLASAEEAEAFVRSL
jgi:inorganic pyrophosphatase